VITAKDDITVSESTEPSVTSPGSSERLSALLRLSTALSHQGLNTLLAQEPIPNDQTTALIKAAHLLRDNDLPWPSVLTQALHELADRLRPP
jgi:hypothetical protein